MFGSARWTKPLLLQFSPRGDSERRGRVLGILQACVASAVTAPRVRWPDSRCQRPTPRPPSSDVAVQGLRQQRPQRRESQGRRSGPPAGRRTVLTQGPRLSRRSVGWWLHLLDRARAP